uniref:N-acetyltransferase domain-containing protein n=1 Tax=Aegilops tauschii subsp. strangulata TaxID=200361 RepID=A0A453IWV5_AEGTS
MSNVSSPVISLQEFHALKKRCGRQVGEKYTCFVAVKNDDVTRTVVNSVVGTVDLCVRHPLHGETYPAEPGNTPFYSRIYQPDQPKFGYLTNVCVAKYARRQGIASNMLLLAIDAARLDGKALGLSGIVKPQIIVVHLLIPSPLIVGAESIYIHVHKDNLPARRLYDHVGFKMVDMDGA